MLPVLFRAGPVTIYSFGVTLFLMTIVVTFLVWKSARRMGLPEEKVLDVLFLSIILAIVAGRAGFVYGHLAEFSADWSRVFFIYKYPGFSYLAMAIFGGVATAILSVGMGLSWTLIVDVFSLAILPSMSLGFLGCFLDGCYADQNLIIIFLLVALCLGVLLNLLANKISHTAEFLEISRRHGLFSLTHLIFLSTSFLMLGEIIGLQLTIGAYFLIAVTVVFLIWRYWQLFRYPIRQIHGAVSQKRPDAN